MSKVKIEGKEYTIGKIFSDDFIFTIPPYQRPYDWDTEKAEALLDDLLGAIGETEETVNNLDPYFLGCIVLIKDDSPEADVVDGQQRLTTLTILLAVLRTLVPSDDYFKNLTDRICQLEDKLLGTKTIYRLSLRKRDDDFFKQYIQEKEGINKLQELNDAELTDSQKHIKENALLFLSRLKGQQKTQLSLFVDSEEQGITDLQILRLAEFIVRQCLLVVVSTPNLETSYRVFSVLNDRGFNISLTDILKAQVIGKIDDEYKEKYQEKWENLEDQLNRENFQTLFSHIRMISRKRKQEKSILEEFKRYIQPSKKPKKFIDEILLPYGNSFRQIKNQCYGQSDSDLSSKINELLKWLNMIDNFDWMPSAILYISQHKNQPNIVKDFLNSLERLAAGLMVMRSNINRRIKRYSDLLEAIENKEDLFKIDSPLQLSYDEQAKIYNTLHGNLYLMDKIRLYVLLRLDSEVSEGTASYDYPVITIEHILPQNPKANSEWLKWFPDKKIREKYLHRIGNLALLSKRKNSSASNYGFQEKKGIYFRTSSGTSPFAITTQVLQESEWTPEVIEKRQKELLNKLVEVWDINIEYLRKHDMISEYSFKS